MAQNHGSHERIAGLLMRVKLFLLLYPDIRTNFARFPHMEMGVFCMYGEFSNRSVC